VNQVLGEVLKSNEEVVSQLTMLMNILKWKICHLPKRQTNGLWITLV
jgi:hypothetical protein